MLSKPTCDLSGGWAMRAALGAALFVKPNLLLLGMVYHTFLFSIFYLHFYAHLYP